MADNEQTEASCRTDITIVLIGTMGSGKSRTGNTILGSDKFKHKLGSILVTEKIDISEVNITDSEHGQLHLTVIDTPGFKKFKEFSNFQKEIKHILRGICVYLFVIRIGRFGSEDKILLEDLFKSKTDIGYRTGIVLTRSAELAEQTVDQWIMDVPTLKQVIDQHDLLYEAIDNADNEKKPRETLIKLITELNNKENPYDAIRFISVSDKEMKFTFGNSGVQFFNRKYEQKLKDENQTRCMPQRKIYRI